MDEENPIQEKKKYQTLLQRKIKQSLRIRDHLLEQLEIAKQWEDVQLEGELIKTHYSVIHAAKSSNQSQITVHNWFTEQDKVLLLDFQLTTEGEMKARFKKAHKMKKSLPHLSREIEKKQNWIVLLNDLLTSLEVCDDEIAFSALLQQLKDNRIYLPGKQKSTQKKLTRELPYYHYYSHNGFEILVGKNAKGNDRLSFVIAKGSDYWFHAHNFPGSHVVLRVDKHREVDQESIEDACQLALYHSKAKEESKAEVVMTEAKYVKKLPGAALGQVQISKHKVIFIKNDPARIHRLSIVNKQKN